jgi:pimeloyl-ACP methyl ester carboxylesterase
MQKRLFVQRLSGGTASSLRTPIRKGARFAAAALGGSLLAGIGCTHTMTEAEILHPSELPVMSTDVRRENVALQTRDGVTLRGWYLTPAAPKHHLVYFYGNGGTVARHGVALYWLAEQLDADILAVDYPGYGFSDGEATLESLSQSTLVSYDAMVSRWPGEPVVAYGFSLGSAFATWLALQRPGIPLILHAPFTSATDVAEYKLDRAPWFIRWFVSLDFEQKLLDWRQPIDMIGEATGPLLVLHGTRDRVFPPSFGERIRAASRSENKMFCPMQHTGHVPLPSGAARSQQLHCLKVFLE